MNDVTRQLNREIDRDILMYVREAQRMAPVTEEAIVRFVTGPRRRRVDESVVTDRIAYNVSAGTLAADTVWDGGEVRHYTITAYGMDVLDGDAPPPNWRPGN